MSACLLTHLAQASVGQAAPALPPAADYGFFSSVVGAGAGEQAVMVVLFAVSVASWGIMAHKYRVVRRAADETDVFLQAFWGSKRLDAIYQRAQELSQSPVSQVFRAGYVELAKLKKRSEAQHAPGHDEMVLGDLESVERSMKRAAAAELAALEAWVPFLATAGSTSPFVGLLGTVVGIIGAFRDIGAVGNANLATVAPSIGGALVATAFGLFAAIPAVVAYNYFTSRVRTLEVEMYNFSADFLNVIKRHFF